MFLDLFPSPTWLEELKLSYDSDPGTTKLLHKLQLGEDVPKDYMLKQGLIMKKGRIFIVKNSPFKGKILDYIHKPWVSVISIQLVGLLINRSITYWLTDR